MRNTIWSRRFTKDFKRERRGRYSKTLEKDVENIVKLLRNDETLPYKYKDHVLIGEYLGKRACHIRQDLVLMYSKDDKKNALILSRLGSHAQVYRL